MSDFNFDLSFDGKTGGGFTQLKEGEFTFIVASVSPQKTQAGNNYVSIDYICVDEELFGASLRMQRSFFHTDGSKKRSAALFGAINGTPFSVKAPVDFAKNLFGHPVRLIVKLKPDQGGVDRLEVDNFKAVTDAQRKEYLALLRDDANQATLKKEITRLVEMNNAFSEKYDGWIDNHHAPLFRDGDIDDAPAKIGSYTKAEYKALPMWIRILIPAKPIAASPPKVEAFNDSFGDDDEDVPF